MYLVQFSTSQVAAFELGELFLARYLASLSMFNSTPFTLTKNNPITFIISFLVIVE